MCKRDRLPDESVEIWGANVRVAEGSDGVEPLLVGAIPEDVGLIGGHSYDGRCSCPC